MMKPGKMISQAMIMMPIASQVSGENAMISPLS
jgi:hypothetical protein